MAHPRGASTWRIYVARLGDAVGDTHSPQSESGVQMAVEADHPDRAAVPIRVGRGNEIRLLVQAHARPSSMLSA